MRATHRLVAYGGGHGKSPNSGESQGNRGVETVCCAVLSISGREDEDFIGERHILLLFTLIPWFLVLENGLVYFLIDNYVVRQRSDA